MTGKGGRLAEAISALVGSRGGPPGVFFVGGEGRPFELKKIHEGLGTFDAWAFWGGAGGSVAHDGGSSTVHERDPGKGAGDTTGQRAVAENCHIATSRGCNGDCIFGRDGAALAVRVLNGDLNKALRVDGDVPDERFQRGLKHEESGCCWKC